MNLIHRYLAPRNRGHYMTPTQIIHDYKGKSNKVTIHLSCNFLIPPKWVMTACRNKSQRSLVTGPVLDNEKTTIFLSILEKNAKSSPSILLVKEILTIVLLIIINNNKVAERCCLVSKCRCCDEGTLPLRLW